MNSEKNYFTPLHIIGLKKTLDESSNTQSNWLSATEHVTIVSIIDLLP